MLELNTINALKCMNIFLYQVVDGCDGKGHHDAEEKKSPDS